MNALTNGFTIKREDGGYERHSLTDFGLAISNTDYIGDPEFETFKVDVPGRRGILDMSEALTGRPVAKTRTIKLHVGTTHPKNDWDGIMSDFRNMYDGRVCKIIFDNDDEWYWIGRVYIQNFSRKQSLGEFDIKMTANAYKHQVTPTIDTYEAPATVVMPYLELPIRPQFCIGENSTTIELWKNGTKEYEYQYGAGEIVSIPGLYTDTTYEVKVAVGDCDVVFEEVSL